MPLYNPPVSSGIPTSALDTDPTLAADSDSKVASQKATKAYVDNNAGGVTNSAPENTLSKSDAGGDLVASSLSDNGVRRFFSGNNPVLFGNAAPNIEASQDFAIVRLVTDGDPDLLGHRLVVYADETETARAISDTQLSAASGADHSLGVTVASVPTQIQSSARPNGDIFQKGLSANSVAWLLDPKGIEDSKRFVFNAIGGAGVIAVIQKDNISVLEIDDTGKVGDPNGNNNGSYFQINDGDETFIVNAENGMAQTAPAASTASILENGQISFFLDEATNKLMVAVKYSDGTTKTGEVALA